MKQDSTKTSGKVPRGIRNNNPLNIRIGNTWLGKIPNPTDSEFEQFVSPVYGLRAAFVILRRYIRRYGRNTPRRIISAWAPSSENHTEQYIKTVCQRTGLAPDSVIDYADIPVMVALVSAMAYVEVGVWLDDKLIMQAYDMA